MKIKFSKEERHYWAQVLIAASQITFGLAWASMFLSVDLAKVLVIVLNLLASGLLWSIGGIIIRRMKK